MSAEYGTIHNIPFFLPPILKIFETRYPATCSENPPLTPLYDSLSTNIPLPVMAFPSFPFPPETSLFPTAAVVQKYLEDYAVHFNLPRFVRLCTRVEKVFWDTDTREWDVTLSTGERLKFDFVVVANGHYRKPRYPLTTGLHSWLDSGRAMHSAWYRRPGEFAHHETVMVVGGGPSAMDLCTDLMGIIPLLLHSVPVSPSQIGDTYANDTETYRKVGRVVEYRDGGSVLLEDGSIELNIDLVILATGYEMSFPFLSQIKSGIPPLPPPLPNELYNSTYHVFPLALHLFPLQGNFPPTSIAFPGLLYRVAPFPLFEDQARAIAGVLEDPASLDRLSCAVDIEARVHTLMRDKGTDDPLHIAKAWSRFALLEPFEYRAQLNAFSGRDWIPAEWEVECWKNKVVLRREWKAIERSGKAGEWIKGVGMNGTDDWTRLCRKLIKQRETSRCHG
jgi:hypothetical protein